MTYCKDCGNPIPKNQTECQSDHSNLHLSMKKSDAWYLLPIFISFVGGIIMYFVLRNKNYKMARKGLCVGIITIAIHLVQFILTVVIDIYLYSL